MVNCAGSRRRSTLLIVGRLVRTNDPQTQTLWGSVRATEALAEVSPNAFKNPSDPFREAAGLSEASPARSLQGPTDCRVMGGEEAAQSLIACCVPSKGLREKEHQGDVPRNR